METLIAPTAESKNYLIKMSAEQSKVSQPILLVIPEVLTTKFDFYLARVLPPSDSGGARPIFLQREGQPRQDFSSATRAVTQHLIGRAFNAHQFRHCIATLFHARSDSSDAMMRQLA
jgi:integrase